MTKKNWSKVKRLFAFLMVFILIVETIPLSIPLQVLSAPVSSFTVEIDSSIKGSSWVSLSNEAIDGDFMEVAVINGKAVFTDFYDSDKSYTLRIRDMIGYADYTESGITGENPDVTYAAADFTSLSMISVSGQVTDENDAPYTGGGTVLYTGYDSGSVSLKPDGSFTVNVFSGKPYTFVLEPSELKYRSPVTMGSINSAINISNMNAKLEIQRFTVQILAGSNGTVTEADNMSLTGIEYGANRRIRAAADAGYQIDLFEVNGNAIPQAAGKAEYLYELSDIQRNYSLRVSFAQKSFQSSFEVDEFGDMKLTKVVSSDVGEVFLYNDASPSFSAIAAAHHRIVSVKIDGVEQITGGNHTLPDEFKHTFDNIDRKHTVDVIFAIDVFDIEIAKGQNGSVTIQNVPAGQKHTVDYGQSLAMVITPNEDYNVEEVLLDGQQVDLASLTDNGESYTYILSNIDKNHRVEVNFSPIPVYNGDMARCYLMTPVNLLGNYPITSGDGTVVFSFLNDNASMTFRPIGDFTKIRINGSYGTSKTYTSSVIITRLEVYGKDSAEGQNAKAKWKRMSLPRMQIIIDKDAPSIELKSGVKWTNQDQVVSGSVVDINTAPNYSSGVTNVLWSKTQLSKSEILSETINSSIVSNGLFSFTISEEYNGNLYVYAVDNAKNVSAPVEVPVTIDRILPEISDFRFKKKDVPVVQQDLNCFPYGTFFNDEIEVVVTARDTGISSGLNEMTIYSDGNEVDKKVMSGTTAVFTLTLDDFSNHTISASVSDKAGNHSDVKKPTEVTSNAKSDIVSLKVEKPEISLIPTSQALYIDGDNQWYSDHVGFDVKVDTNSGGIYSVDIEINGNKVTKDKNDKAIDQLFYEAQTLHEEFLVHTDQYPLEGQNTVKVTAVNNYGNQETTVYVVHVDKTNPEIVGFEITEEDGSPLDKAFHFLTFGAFHNKKVKITVTADDRYGPESGVDTTTLYLNGKPLAGSPKKAMGMEDGKYQTEYVMPEEIFAETKYVDAVLSAVATDNVGNITGKNKENPIGVPANPTSVNSDLESDRLVIETVRPVIGITQPEPVYTDEVGRKWYADNTQFTVTAEDIDSGIRSVSISLNGVQLSADAEGKYIQSLFFEKETHKEVFLINTSQGTRAEDGSYEIQVTVTDNAGNVHTASGKVYKDTDAPKITGFRFVPATADNISETEEFITELEYGFFFKKEFTAMVQMTDVEPSSGLRDMAYRLVSYENGKVKNEVTGVSKIEDGLGLISVPQGFKGQIFVEAFDNTMNKSVEVTTKAYVVDGTLPEITITNQNTTEHRDEQGNPLFVSDVGLTVVITDKDSGIMEIGYAKSAELESVERKSIVLEKTGYHVGDILDDGWEISEMDANLVTKVTKLFTYTGDDNNVVLTVDASDHASNRKQNVNSEKMTIDKTSPLIQVTFREDDPKNHYYYSANRIADIKVTERNFDAARILTEIENKFGQVPKFAFKKVSRTLHTAVIRFDEGDYTFDISGTDRGNHAAKVDFSGGNERKFFVDKTLPVTEHNFAEFSNGLTENSFREDKTATIRVVEHNFDPNLVQLSIRQKMPGEAHNAQNLSKATGMILRDAEWSSSGDVHTLSFTFNMDGVYQIEMAPMDLAENSIDASRTVVFEMDKTVPVVMAKNGRTVKENATTLLDVYPYARKDEPTPTVEFYDINIAHIQYTLTEYIPDYSGKEAATVLRPVRRYMKQDKNQSGQVSGNRITLPDFKRDGIYSLVLTAVDTAGNESLVNENTYAKMIEQDVLAYILDSNMRKKTGVYSLQYENGDTISKRPDNFSDIKVMVLAKKGSDTEIVLRDNNAEEIITNAEAAADNSLHGIGLYNYTLKSSFFKETFQDDTDAELLLSVKNDGNRIDLARMHIDNIAPTGNIPGDLKSWKWYYGDKERTFTVSNMSELVDEKQTKVYNNGQEMKFDYLSDSNELKFTLGKGWHNVGIILGDMAGNTYNVNEKANIHIGFFWLWVMVAGAVVLVTTIAGTVIYSIKKKRIMENEF